MTGGGDDAKAWLAGVFDRAAPTYDRVGDAYHDYFGERLVELAGVAVGDRVLDVACGRGASLVPAARRAGGSGQVLGVDLSPEMVAAAAAELTAAGLDGAARVMDAEHLDLADSAYDVALCGFGVFFFPDPEAAMAEIFRVVRPGGTVALSTWGADDERWSWEDDLMASLEAGRRALVRPFDDVADLAALLGRAGFVDRATSSRTGTCTSPTSTCGGTGSGPTACAASWSSRTRQPWRVSSDKPPSACGPTRMRTASRAG